METTIGFIMIAIVIAVLLWGKISTIPLLIVLPFVCALLCGYAPMQAAGFMLAGQASVSGVVLLFSFAIVYFNALNDVGVFDLLINKLLKIMGNRPWVALLVAACVAAISHLDGSGATTVAITIPLMMPIFKKMKLSGTSLLFIMSVAIAIINLLPWTAPAMGLAAVIGSNPQEVWTSLVPVQIACAVLVVVFCFVIERIEVKKGAGMSDAEFAELRKTFDQPVEVKVSKPILIFDLILTVLLIMALLFAWLPAPVCFMVGLSLVLLTNFKGTKEQMDVIRRHAPAALTMILMMMAIGAFSGVLSQTKMLSGMVGAILSILPESLGSHLVLIIALVAPILAVCLGNATVSTALAPILAGVVMQYGATANHLAAAIMIGISLAANYSFLVPSTYMALGLAETEMGDHMKYSFGWIMLINVILVIVAGLTGAITF